MDHAQSEATTSVSGADPVRLWPRSIDDRGRTFAFIPSAVLSWRERAVRQDALPLVLLVVANAIVFAVYAQLRPMLPAPWRWLLAISLLAILIYAGSVVVRAREIREQRRVARAKGVCTACGYPIAELEPQADGCRVCPECGCAWKLDEGTSHLPL